MTDRRVVSLERPGQGQAYAVDQRRRGARAERQRWPAPAPGGPDKPGLQGPTGWRAEQKTWRPKRGGRQPRRPDRPRAPRPTPTATGSAPEEAALCRRRPPGRAGATSITSDSVGSIRAVTNTVSVRVNPSKGADHVKALARSDAGAGHRPASHATPWSPTELCEFRLWLRPHPRSFVSTDDGIGASVWVMIAEVGVVQSAEGQALEPVSWRELYCGHRWGVVRLAGLPHPPPPPGRSPAGRAAPRASSGRPAISGQQDCQPDARTIHQAMTPEGTRGAAAGDPHEWEPRRARPAACVLRRRQSTVRAVSAFVYDLRHTIRVHKERSALLEVPWLSHHGQGRSGVIAAGRLCGVQAASALAGTLEASGISGKGPLLRSCTRRCDQRRGPRAPRTEQPHRARLPV